MKRLRPADSDEEDEPRRGPASITNHDPVHNQAVTQTNNGPIHHAPVYHTHIAGHHRATQQEQRDLLDQLSPQEKRRRCLEALKFARMDSRRDNIRGAHSQTCEWLLNQAEYQDWTNGKRLDYHHGFLWIKGKPGTGKSTITKHAFDQTRRSPASNVISFFFNARGEALEKSSSGMYRSLLVQLLAMMPDLQDVLDDHFHALLDSDPTSISLLGDEVLQHLLRRATTRLGQRDLVCFIDALDECNEYQARDMVRFFSELGELAVSSNIRFRTFLSSRHYPHINIDRCLEIILEHQDGHSNDLSLYIASELRIGRSKLATQIKDEILGRACGIFLWVVLVIGILNREYDHGRIHALRKRLDTIPNDLEELFHDILTRDGTIGPEIVLCLQWVLFARRSLRPEELYLGILGGIEPDEVNIWDENEVTRDDVRRFVLHASKGLVEETRGKAPTIQFIHESVRGFFLKGAGLQASLWGPPETFEARGHDQLKRCCYNYYRKAKAQERLRLPRPLPKASSEEADKLRFQLRQQYPLLEYSVQHMFYHCDVAHKLEINQTHFLTEVDLLEWIYQHNLIQQYQINRYSPLVTLLYILAELDLPHLTAIELKRTDDIHTIGGRYGYPLFAAIAKGNEGVIRALLLPSDFNSLAPDGQNQCTSDIDVRRATAALLKRKDDVAKSWHPLPWAVSRNEDSVVKCLLARKNVDVNTIYQIRGIGPRTLVSVAAESGHTKVLANLLATEGIEVNDVFQLGENVLHLAACNGHSEAVKVLLTHRDWKNLRGSDGKTALHMAAQNGHSEVVTVLLDNDHCDINSTDDSQSTALHVAATWGCSKVVKLLLAHGGCKLNLTNRNRETALHIAAWYGHSKVVKVLIVHDECDIDARDFTMYTALHDAVRRHRCEVVKMLLGRTDCDVNTTDLVGNTALHMAARSGNGEIAKALLDREDCGVNSTNFQGETALLLATENGSNEMVEILLAHSGCNVDIHPPDQKGRTPFCVAIERGCERIVERLIAHPGAKINEKDPRGMTPLMMAAREGSLDLVSRLLTHEHIEVDACNKHGYTAFSYAFWSKKFEVAKLLLDHGNVNLACDGISHETPLHCATSQRNMDIAQHALSRGADVDKRDIRGQTSLHYALYAQDTDITKLLLAAHAVDIDAQDSCGRAPLHVAAHYGGEEMMQLLLACDTINTNTQDNHGRTPLHWALNAAHVSAVRQLLTTESIDVNAQDINGWTPLHYAASKGDTDSAKSLLAHDSIEVFVLNKDGYDPINLARLNKHWDFVMLLEVAMIIRFNILDGREMIQEAFDL